MKKWLASIGLIAPFTAGAATLMMDTNGNITAPLGFLTNSLKQGSNIVVQATNDGAKVWIHGNPATFVEAGLNVTVATNSGVYTISTVGGSATNAVSTVASNGTIFSTGATNLNFYGLTRLTNDNGDVSIGLYIDDKTNSPVLMRTNVSFLSQVSNQFAGDLKVAGDLYATKGLAYSGKASFYTNYTVIPTEQVYTCNGTNQLLTLPDCTTTIPWVIYRFTSTNTHGSFILTNATGAQTLRDGVSLSYKNEGIGSVAFYTDGACWLIGSKARTVLPNAVWSTSTNVTFAANTAKAISYDTAENNNGQGLGKVGWTQLWVTNSGQYLITFSAVISKTDAGADSCDIWLAEQGNSVARSRTKVTLTSANEMRVMTVNYIVPVTTTTYFELYAATADTALTITAEAALSSPFAAPAMPSIIVTVNKVSD